AGAAAGVVSAPVVALADGVAKGLSAAGWKPLAAVLLVVPLSAAGAATLVPRGSEPPAVAARPAPPQPAEPRQAPAPAARPAEKSDREKLQGTWVVVQAWSNGKLVIDPVLGETQFVFAGGRCTHRTKKGPREGTYHLDPTQSPGALDVSLDGALVMNFIYEVTDSRLKLCWSKGGPRPAGFDTAKHPDTILFVLEKR